MATSDSKEDALRDIADHLAKHGPGMWEKVRSKYKEVPDPTWWRWVKKVRDGVASGESLATARKKLAARAKGAKPEDVMKAVTGNLPAPPSPDYIARNGEQGMKNIDYLEAVNGLFSDAMLLREYSLNAEGKIRIPSFFEKSIKSRIDVLNTGANLLQQVYDLQRMEAFYQAIIEEIGRESIDLQQRVVARLATLNQATGLSYCPAVE